jgi:hypothetical protein
MDKDELTALIDKTATLMTQYERRGAAIDSRLHALADTLQGLAQQLPAVVRTSADGALLALPAEMGSVVREGLGPAIGDYRGRLAAASDEVEKAARTLAGQLGHLQRLHRQLIWKTVGAAVLALALLLASGVWLSMHYARVIRDNQIAAELLKAYNAADVTLCGSGTLCANVDTRGARHGEHRQYLPVKPR